MFCRCHSFYGTFNVLSSPLAIDPRFLRNFLLWSLQPGDSLRDALAHGKGEDYPVCLGRRAAFFPYFVHTCCWVLQVSHFLNTAFKSGKPGAPLYQPVHWDAIEVFLVVQDGSSRYEHPIFVCLSYLFPAQNSGDMFPGGKKQNDCMICVLCAGGIESSNQVGCQCMLYWSLWALVRRGNFLFELRASCVCFFSFRPYTDMGLASTPRTYERT